MSKCHIDGNLMSRLIYEPAYEFFNSSIANVICRGIARDLNLKPTKTWRDISPSYFTFQIGNNKGTDQPAQTSLRLCC